MNIRRLFFTTLILFAHNVFAQVKKTEWERDGRIWVG